jgi:dissimilatory sulfite reductase (desulfoviridin) alpha/beta subunit
MTAEQMVKIAEISQKYGRGKMGFTSRMCVEVPWIKYEDIEAVKKEMEESGLVTGGTGLKVEPILACKGTVCSYGLVDTQDLCSKLHERHFAKDLPAKFKIGIVGCPNNCVKAPVNDLGFMGQRIPAVLEDKCKGCQLCVKECPVKAIEKVDKVVKIDYDKCIHCGRCVKVCPFKAMVPEKEGVAVFLGGKFGRKHRIGNRIESIFSLEEAEIIADKVIDYYNKYGNPHERFGDTIDRIGLENVQAAIFEE